VNVPKLLRDDLPLFENIFAYIFPTTEGPVVDYGELSNTMVEVCEELNTQPVEQYTKKVVQLLDTLRVRPR